MFGVVGDKPMTFSGRSYARWRLVDKMERRLSLAIKVKTRKATASLMYATGQRDYSILEVNINVRKLHRASKQPDKVSEDIYVY